MKSVFALMGLALAGCTTVGSIQADCQKSTSTFGAMAQCIDARLSQEGRLARHPSVQLYSLKTKQLAQRVESGKISDLDARVELQQLFVQLQKQEDDDTDVLITVPAQNRPMRTNCTTYGNSTSCTSR